MAETGHAKNIANFGTLISFVQGYGAAYAPSNAAMSRQPCLRSWWRLKNAIKEDNCGKVVFSFDDM